jgi:hypothetical protein
MQIKPIGPAFGQPPVQKSAETAKPAFVRGAATSAMTNAGLDPRTRAEVSRTVAACARLNLPFGQNVPAYVGNKTMALQSSTTGKGFLLQELAKSTPGSRYPTALYMDGDGHMKLDGENVDRHSRRFKEAVQLLAAFSQSLERGGVQGREAVAADE